MEHPRKEKISSFLRWVSGVSQEEHALLLIPHPGNDMSPPSLLDARCRYQGAAPKAGHLSEWRPLAIPKSIQSCKVPGVDVFSLRMLGEVNLSVDQVDVIRNLKSSPDGSFEVVKQPGRKIGHVELQTTDTYLHMGMGPTPVFASPQGRFTSFAGSTQAPRI